VTGIDLSSMQPPDAAVALRTLPRRYRDAARTASTVDLDVEPDDVAVDEVAGRVGPDGHSAADIVAAAVDHVEAMDRTLRSALVSDTVVVPRILLDGVPTIAHSDAALRFADSVDQLSARCMALADLVDGADPARWTASITADSGGTTTPLEVLQSGVAVLVGWERELAPTLRAVRGRPG
jgi:hypothetical protein